MAYEILAPQSLGLAAMATIYTALPDGMSVGQEVDGVDRVTGRTGKFKLLYGVGSTLVGSLVVYDENTGLTTLAPNTANLAMPLAVAMSANTATTSLAWYQISGLATVKKTAVKVSPNVAIFLSATAGRIMPTVASGKQIIGARAVPTATVASTTSTVLVGIRYPIAQGQTI